MIAVWTRDMGREWTQPLFYEDSSCRHREKDRVFKQCIRTNVCMNIMTI